jgi:hypothetical protein
MTEAISDPAWLTISHTVISLIGILTGIVVAWGLVTDRTVPTWTLVFLVTTVATSASGYLFHRDHILPSQIVGAISLALLATAILALYQFRLAGAWRWIYVVTAALSLYLNVFVLIIQSFLKVPFLHALAPNGSEPAFVISQGAALILFLALTVVAIGRFHPATADIAE